MADGSPANASSPEIVTRGPVPELRQLDWMTPWYGPRALTETGINAFTSHTISAIADQRVLQAALDNIDEEALAYRYVYGPHQPEERHLPLDKDNAFWIDYVADTGDGFDSTFAVASLLSQPALDVGDGRGGKLALPAGGILFMGGDQTYPFANDQRYRDRLLRPFNMATQYTSTAMPPPRRKLFALPGNHDWYDGLAAFDRLFCSSRDGFSRGRRFGVWECQQHRSYWAVKLPHDWWVWGLDVQLNNTLDVGQIQYFHRVSQSISSSPDDTKIIICIPSPAWHEGDEAQSITAYSYDLLALLNRAIERGRVVTILTGDWHHYSRYFSPEYRLNLITAGGGGAYMAPTHQLKSVLHVPWKVRAPGSKPQSIDFHIDGPTSTDDAALEAWRRESSKRTEALFPERTTSKWLSWHIPLFPVYNPTFCMALGFIYCVLWWFFTSTLIPFSAELQEAFRNVPSLQRYVAKEAPWQMISADEILKRGELLSLWQQIKMPWTVSRWQPFFALSALSIFGLIYGFLAGSKRLLVRLVETTIVFFVHIYVMSLMSQTILAVGDRLIGGGSVEVIVNSTVMFILASGVAGVISGIYLFLGNRLFGTHEDNAFSAIRIASYKNFLRMKVTPSELTIYPIGVRAVPHRAMGFWRAAGWRKPDVREIAELVAKTGAAPAYVAKKGLTPELIEQPIVIRPAEIRQLDTGPPSKAPPPLPVADRGAPPVTLAAIPMAVAASTGPAPYPPSHKEIS